MEMELMYSRGMDSINGEGYEGMDEGEHSSIFKQKYERAAKELEYTKQRLQQQHEDDLEQLVALKKQLEKHCMLSIFTSDISCYTADVTFIGIQPYWHCLLPLAYHGYTKNTEVYEYLT